MKKNIIIVLSALLMMTICMLVFSAKASAAEVVASGNCGAEGDGSNVTWMLDTDGKLEISGEGAMADYTVSSMPWGSYRTSITSLVINEGIDTIGEYSFARCSNLETVDIPGSLLLIKKYAFYNCSSLARVNYDGTEVQFEGIMIDEKNTPFMESVIYYSTTAVVVREGSCGYETTWTLYNDGLLTITGERMYDYSPRNDTPPWGPWRTAIRKVIIDYGVTNIGEGAFYSCTGLRSITIPESVTSIGDSAFNRCTSLRSITIPEGVTSIGGYAFYNCTNLSTITIPEGVTSIGKSTFNGCTSLSSITIPEGVTDIGNSAFQDCTTLTSVTIRAGVANVGESAFKGCSSLTRITFSEGVTSIGGSTSQNSISSYAFSGCTNLTSITIPEGVTSIGGYAFYNCTSLSSITIPEGVTSIGERAFYYCTGLNSITIPEGVTSIGEYAFYNCTNLSSITIPEGVTSIGDSTFNGCMSLSSITIPEGVTSIGDAAFKHCVGLRSITIPESVTSIGEYAFYTCGLNSITIPEGVTSIGEYTFYESSLSSITIPEGVTSIGKYAFYHCSLLSSITIPEGVTSISYSTFYNCVSLSSIVLPQTLTNIDSYAFWGCRTLTDVYYSGAEADWPLIIIEDSNSNNYLAKASIHYNYVYEIREIASGGGGTGLAWSFYSNGKLVISGEGEMQDYLTDAAPWDKYKTRIKEVLIEDGVSNVSSGSFEGFPALTKVEVSGGSRIDDYAFSDCGSLSDVRLGNRISTIGEGAFLGCSGLETLRLPASLTVIKEDAFDLCEQLSSVHYCGTEESWEAVTILSGNEPLLSAEKSYGHDWSDWIINEEPSSAGNEEKSRTCSMCGACESVVIPGGETLLNLTFRHNCEFADNIALHYIVPQSELAGYSNIRLRIQMEKYAEGASEATLQEYMITEWSEYVLNDTPYYRFIFPGIFAAEMGNKVFATVVAEKEGKEYSSGIDEYSVKEYAYNRLEKTSSASYRTFLVDMLNYGAAAQIHFNKNSSAEKLVNADLTETQREYGTQGTPELVNNESTETLAGATAVINGKNLVFDSSVFLRYRMGFAEGQDMSGVKIVFTYMDSKGVQKSQTVTSRSFNASGSYYTADCTMIIPSDMKCIITATIYDGATPISDSLNYSIETYVYNRLRSSSSETFKNLINQMIKYGISAKNHFS